MEKQVVMILVVLIYLSFCILWGFYQGRKVKTGKDYAIAGRKFTVGRMSRIRKYILDNF